MTVTRETYIVCPGERAVRAAVVEAGPGEGGPAVGLLLHPATRDLVTRDT